jgi:methionine synthase I (cobalamin-dependent)
MKPLIQSLMEGGPVLTDGAWGTQLQAKGLQGGECPDLWNLSHPEHVTAVARAYVLSGSRIILTNTFGANKLRLAGYGLSDQAVDINKAGVAISRAAAGNQALVFASLGPSGKMLMMGDTTEEELLAVFTEQARAMAEGGADAIVIETMADLTETKLAVTAAKATGLPVVACLVFDSGKNKDRTMMGNTPEQVAAALTEAGVDVIGANCGQGISGYVGVCKRMRAVTTLPLWIKANAGLPEMVAGVPVYRTTAGEFADHMPALMHAGANFIGGCCGTSPDFIAACKTKL